MKTENKILDIIWQKFNDRLGEMDKGEILLSIQEEDILLGKIFNLIKADQFTPKEEDKWIDVKEQKPEYGVKVAVYGKWVRSGKGIYGLLYRVNEDDVEWRTADDDSETNYSIQVTHWMPLPSPPSLTDNKEENGNM